MHCVVVLVAVILDRFSQLLAPGFSGAGGSGAIGESTKNILVYHLGGGAFDVSILRIDVGGDAMKLQVLAASGDSSFGGEELNRRFVNHLVDSIKADYSLDISNDSEALRDLREGFERAKKSLSSEQDALLRFESLFGSFSEPLTRKRMEIWSGSSFNMTMVSVEKVLRESGIEKADIHDIVLVGGSSRIPMVQELLKDFFHGQEPYKGVNHDEAAVFGAAVLGGVLSGEGGYETKDLRLLDVISFNLAIGIGDGSLILLIPRNTVIPIKMSHKFSTNETWVPISVYECETTWVKDCRELGSFILSGTKPASSSRTSTTKIEVKFEVDASGTLHVQAGTDGYPEGKKLHKRSISYQEIERMVKEAEEYVKNVNEVREEIGSRNKLETYIYNMSSRLEEALGWLDYNQNAKKDDFVQKLKEVRTVLCNKS